MNENKTTQKQTTKKPRGRPPIEFNSDHAKTVLALAQYGVPEEDICEVIDCCVETMHKLYKRELRKGKALAKAALAQTAYKKAIDGDTTMLIFQCKVRLGMSEKTVNEISGINGNPIKIESQDVKQLTNEELLEIARLNVEDGENNKT